jgi:hypothetical protein
MSRRKVKHTETPPSRRDFARTLVTIAAAPLAVAAFGSHSATSGPPDLVAEAAMTLTDLAHNRYGAFLTRDQVQALKRRFASTILTGQRLKQFKLQNSDEPAFLFRADVP